MGVDGDLHTAFTTPQEAPVEDRMAFLAAVDRLPEFAQVRARMRDIAPLPVDGVVVDAGCGPGWEAARLAADHPRTTVIGLDHDRASLAAAAAREQRDNLQWRHGDLAALDLDPQSVDVVRTERVLMYLEDLPGAVSSIARALTPGGALAAFELDYGATVLATAGHPPERVRSITACLERALPQPWAGRLLPEVCSTAGLEVVAVEPHAFTVDHAVWSRIVGATVRATRSTDGLDDGVDDWLAALDQPDGPVLRGAFVGILTVARAPG